MRQTKTHIYFLNGHFSQWHPSPFRGQLAEGEGGMAFSCAEQYMMASKARLFKDDLSLDKIMWTSNPAEQKRLGRKVAGFDKATWERVAQDVVFRGNFYRMMEDAGYRKAILASGKKIIVEAADYDPIWGVGLRETDDDILDEANWRGTNWLGIAHMKVRAVYRAWVQLKKEGNPNCFFNPHTEEFMLLGKS